MLQYDKNSAYAMSFNVSEEKEWMSQYKKIWNDVASQLFEKLTTELIKGKYVRGKLKKWKKDIKTNFRILGKQPRTLYSIRQQTA